MTLGPDADADADGDADAVPDAGSDPAWPGHGGGG